VGAREVVTEAAEGLHDGKELLLPGVVVGLVFVQSGRVKGNGAAFRLLEHSADGNI
jgi:hypothetical protein